MSEDPFYKRCCVTGRTHGKIDWHHNLIYAGRQVNEVWCILPVIDVVHAKADNRGIRMILDWIMLNRADTATLLRYSRVTNLVRRRDVCNEVFGVWKEGEYATPSRILSAKLFTHS